MSQSIFTEGIGYEGKVTLTLKSNNQILGSKTYKNKGTSQLFRFLGNCLLGEFEEASALLPTKILLLWNQSESPLFDDNPNDVTKSSNWEPYKQLPAIIEDSYAQQIKVVYSFEVPRASIVDPFNQVALYGQDITDETEFSAFYYLVTNEGNWELLNASDWSPSTVLLIEWELSISNKNTGTNNSGKE